MTVIGGYSVDIGLLPLYRVFKFWLYFTNKVNGPAMLVAKLWAIADLAALEFF